MQRADVEPTHRTLEPYQECPLSLEHFLLVPVAGKVQATCGLWVVSDPCRYSGTRAGGDVTLGEGHKATSACFKRARADQGPARKKCPLPLPLPLLLPPSLPGPLLRACDSRPSLHIYKTTSTGARLNKAGISGSTMKKLRCGTQTLPVLKPPERLAGGRVSYSKDHSGRCGRSQGNFEIIGRQFARLRHVNRGENMHR